MSGEHAWLNGMITTLDSELNTAGITNNRNAVVGFGGSDRRSHRDGQEHDVGGSQFGNASQASAAFNTLVTSGGTEDGYDGRVLDNIDPMKALLVLGFNISHWKTSSLY